MNEQPQSPQKAPYAVMVEKGKRYFWCACGRSANQPFCDGSHQGTSFNPVPFRAEKNEYIWFCGCKHSATQPFCDGTHSRLEK